MGGRVGLELTAQARAWSPAKGIAANDTLQLGGKLHLPAEERRAMVQAHPEKAATNADSYAFLCMQYARLG